MISRPSNSKAILTLLVCLTVATGCDSPKLTPEQRATFEDRVLPRLESFREALAATNAASASPAPFTFRHVTRLHAAIDAETWDVYRDHVAYRFERLPTGTVGLVSLLSDDPRIHLAMSALRERLALTPSTNLRLSMQVGSQAILNQTLPSGTNEYRRSANLIMHVASLLGYEINRGCVVPGTELGLVLHYRKPSPNGPSWAMTNSRGIVVPTLKSPPWTEPNSGGYVGLYSASTNLSSVDLIVLVYSGKVQAILQRSKAPSGSRNAEPSSYPP